MGWGTVSDTILFLISVLLSLIPIAVCAIPFVLIIKREKKEDWGNVSLNDVTRRIDWVRTNLQHFLCIGLFWTFAYMRWQTMTFLNETIIQQLHYNPHIYRLWTQLLISLDGIPFSFATLVSVTFALTATLLYLVCPPKDRLVLASFLLLVAASGSMR